jgi:hypothetical protein
MANSKYPLVLGMAAMLALGTTSQSIAAPVPGSAAAVKSAAAGDTINVQWRRWGGRAGWGRGWGWGPGLGIGLGLGLAGAAAAAPYYGGYGYCSYGYCGGPDYAYVEAPAVVVASGYGYAGPYYGGWGRW